MQSGIVPDPGPLLFLLFNPCFQVVLFNPRAQARTVTVDLSLLPPALLAAEIVPLDLITNVSAGTPLAANWTVTMPAGSFAAFGFRFGVFAPRRGKFERCSPTDGHSARIPSATTLQACFLACARDAKCENVFVTIPALPRWLEKPAPIVCTVLGAVGSTTVSCPKAGAGTLIAALPGPRPTPKRASTP